MMNCNGVKLTEIGTIGNSKGTMDLCYFIVKMQKLNLVKETEQWHLYLL